MMEMISLNSIDFSNDKYVEVKKWNNLPFELMIDEVAHVDLTLSEEGLPVYFGTIDYYLDQTSHLSAYGGYLTYTVEYKSGLSGKAIIAPDVVLIGQNLTFVHQSYEQPANGRPFRGAVQMVESSFTTVSGGAVTRELFMMLLRDLDKIYIRATYWEPSLSAEIKDIYLTIADEDEENYNLYEELSVEKCSCPQGYAGNSCEDCAEGYYRIKEGPYGGYCVPCQCNGHAATCDCDTGICNVC